MKRRQPPWPVELWPTLLNQALAAAGGPVTRAIVLHKTDSTQDAARRLEARVGDVVVAWRQTHGRGRLGRTWADTGEDGAALTVVLPRDRPERLAIASALAVSAAVAITCRRKTRRVAIKWPNDIFIGRRKVAGVLVEQVEDRAFIGVGVNVNQMQWPADLRRSAVSIRQAGVRTDRLRVIIRVLLALQLALKKDDARLARDFAKRDALSGEVCRFRSGRRTIRGKVLRIDPMHGLSVATPHGEEWLPAATTTVIKE